MKSSEEIQIRRELEDSIATREFWSSKWVTVPGETVGVGITGAGIGFLVGGPPGVVVGGAIGAIIGFIAGFFTSDPLRKWLTDDKKFRLFCMHLNVNYENATPPEIRRNYRYMMKVDHPDQHRDAPETMLADFRKRTEYHKEAFEFVKQYLTIKGLWDSLPD